MIEIDYERLPCPVWFIWGSRDNRATRHSTKLTHIDDAKALVEQIRASGKDDVGFVELDGGHTILYDEPELVVDAIRQALGRSSPR